MPCRQSHTHTYIYNIYICFNNAAAQIKETVLKSKPEKKGRPTRCRGEMDEMFLAKGNVTYALSLISPLASHQAALQLAQHAANSKKVVGRCLAVASQPALACCN